MPAHDALEVGSQLRQARRLRGLTLKDLSERTGLSLRFLSEIERGKDGASLGRVLRVAQVLGVDMPLQIEPQARVDIDRYPGLRAIAWQRRDRFIDESDALALYEANWRFIDREQLLPRELALIDQLALRHGHRVLNG